MNINCYSTILQSQASKTSTPPKITSFPNETKSSELITDAELFKTRVSDGSRTKSRPPALTFHPPLLMRSANELPTLIILF